MLTPFPGAGATATTDIDWYKAWKNSKEALNVEKQLQEIITEGRARPPVATELHSEFSTNWLFQVKTLLKRDMQRHWRDTEYLMAKLALNIMAGLFIGFTFWKAKDSIQGTQNKLFVRFILSCGLVCTRAYSFDCTGYLHEHHLVCATRQPVAGSVHLYSQRL